MLTILEAFLLSLIIFRIIPKGLGYALMIFGIL